MSDGEPIPNPTAEHRNNAEQVSKDMEATWRKTVRGLLVKVLIAKIKSLALAQLFAIVNWILTMAAIALGFWVLGAIFGHETRWSNLSYPAWFAGTGIVALFFLVAVWGPLSSVMRRSASEENDTAGSSSDTGPAIFRL